MKKIRRILSFVVAMAMIMSMSTLCFLVTAEGTGVQTGTETEWSLGANAFEIGAAGSTALLTKGPFMIDLVGKQLSATVVDVNGVASIQTTEGKTAFAKSASGIIDLAPAEGDARVTFTAPADGTYAFAISVEKTDMPAYAEGSKVKNWTQIGAVTSSGAGFGGWNDIVGTDTQGYAGKGITNESGWGGNSGVNTVLSQSAAVKLTAGQCITVSVSKEGDCDNTHTTLKTFNVSKVEDGVVWSMGDEFKIGDVGSTAVISSGFFGIDLKEKTLSTTVVNNGGATSIVSTDGVRAFTKSANGIIDLTPAVNATSQVYFKAPVDGTYWFSIQAVKTDMSGVAKGETVKNWTEIGPKASLAAGYNSTSDFRNGQNYTGQAIGNTNDFPQKEIAIANTATLKAGEVITISINAQGTSNETQTTLTQFDVLKLPASVTTDTFASTIGTPDAIGTVTKNNFTLGSINSVTNNLEGTSFRPVDATKLVPAWDNANGYYAWSVFVNEADRPIFGTSQTGSSMDMMPKNAVPSVITYTAPSDGVYLYDAIVKRSNGSPDKSIAVIVGTGNASGAYVGELEKTEIAANQTLLVNGTVELKKGDTIWLVANNYDAAESAEVGVNKLEVTRVGDYVPEEEHVCTEWNNDGTCKTGATCVSCGEKTGATNANNHELNTFTYVDTGEGTHYKLHECCDVAAAENVPHDFTNGDCECGAEAPVVAPTDYLVNLTASAASVSKNSNVTVTIMLSGDKGAYAAGEAVVTYDPTVFEYVGTDLTGNTVKVTVNDGKIVIVVAGEEIDFSEEDSCDVVTLTFKAIAETTGSDIVVESAAFSTKADAKVDDLTAAIIETDTVSVEVTAQNFNVTIDQEKLTGNSTVTDGENYTFTYKDYDPYYKYDGVIRVEVGGADVTENVTFADGTWTIDAQYIDADIVISVVGERTAMDFTVTITPDGWATGNENAYYKTDYTFEITKEDTYTDTQDGYKHELGSITIGDVPYTGAITTDGKNYTIPGDAITGVIKITIIATPVTAGETTVTKTSPDEINVNAADKATLGAPFTFTVDFSNADPLYTYTVYYNGAEIEAVEGVYTIEEVTEAVIITVEKKLTTKVSVVEDAYLTIEDEDGVATYMWLVLNDVERLNSGVYTINGENMFWSDKYEAYCFLVIAPVAPTVDTIEVALSTNGSTTDVDYGMNVNMSANGVDANDAQFVWNMYNTEYKSFADVSMAKFLRADVNGDMEVGVGDAAAIITACVEKYTVSN